MAKQYSLASADVSQRIRKLREQYHSQLDLEGYEPVTLCLLFVFNDAAGHVLEFQGYPAAAVTKITSTKDRAAGMADAVIVIDRFTYSGMQPAQKDALLDHELYHLERVVDEFGKPKCDSNGRPKLELRKHDVQTGWFHEIARRHGEASIEVRQARHIIAATQQLYFDFGATRQDEAA